MADYHYCEVDGSFKRTSLEADSVVDFPKHHLVPRGRDVCDSGVSLSYLGEESLPSLGCENLPKSRTEDGASPCVSVGYASYTGPEDVVVDSVLTGQMEDMCISSDSALTTTTSTPSEQTPCQPTEDVDRRRAFMERLQFYFTPDDDGDTKLHLAVISGNMDAVMYLVLAAASCASSLLDLQNREFRQTALHLAVVTDQPAVVRLLVNAGASRDVRDRHGNTPLHLACKRGLIRCLVEMMKAFSIDERAQVMQYCIYAGLPAFKPPAFRLPNVNTPDYEGLSCLHMVEMWKCNAQLAAHRIPAIHFLLQSCGANVNVQECKSGHSLLHSAVKHNDTQLLTYLLQVPSLDVNLPTYSRRTALDMADMLGHHDMLLQLKSISGQHSADYCPDSTSDSDDMDSFDDLTIAGQRRSLHNSFH